MSLRQSVLKKSTCVKKPPLPTQNVHFIPVLNLQDIVKECTIMRKSILFQVTATIKETEICGQQN